MPTCCVITSCSTRRESSTPCSLRESGFSLGSMAERAADPLAFLARVWDQNLGKRCVGFKMTRGQDPRVLDALFADAKVRVIVLRRANRIKAFVSEMRAEAAKRWEVYDPAELGPARPKVRVERRRSRPMSRTTRRSTRRFDAALARSGSPVLRVTYERLFRDDEQQRMLGFLGLPGGGCDPERQEREAELMRLARSDRKLRRTRPRVRRHGVRGRARGSRDVSPP